MVHPLVVRVCALQHGTHLAQLVMLWGSLQDLHPKCAAASSSLCSHARRVPSMKLLAGSALMAYCGLWLAVILAEKPGKAHGSGGSKRSK